MVRRDVAVVRAAVLPSTKDSGAAAFEAVRVMILEVTVRTPDAAMVRVVPSAILIPVTDVEEAEVTVAVEVRRERDVLIAAWPSIANMLAAPLAVEMATVFPEIVRGFLNAAFPVQKFIFTNMALAEPEVERETTLLLTVMVLGLEVDWLGNATSEIAEDAAANPLLCEIW